MGYVETLFGHQDRISDIDALRGETALTSGCRDKTVRYWKIADETQIVFRGGTKSALRDALEGGLDAGGNDIMEVDDVKRRKGKQDFVEGSMECVAMVDETTFLSGGDSGCVHSDPLLCYWADIGAGRYLCGLRQKRSQFSSTGLLMDYRSSLWELMPQ